MVSPSHSPGYYSLDPEKATLSPNSGRCLECQRWLTDGDDLTCPVDPEHTVEPLHSAVEGLGYLNDDDFYNWDRGRFEYPATG